MKYKTVDLEKMSNEELTNAYRNANISLKKDILKSLANSGKFAVLMSQLDLSELIDMAYIHPYKGVVVDTVIDEMESHGLQMAIYNDRNRESFNEFMDALQYRSFFSKIKDFITGKSALPMTLTKMIEQAKKLYEITVRRTNATGKKMEQLEAQDLDKAVDNSRVEVNTGEMAKVFDRYAKEARKDGNFFERYEVNTDVANRLVEQLTEEYILALGKEKEDVARLVAMKEFESYSGQSFYIPYPRSILCR